MHITHYDELTWEEIRDLDKDRVVLLPIATIEDHGPHLPVNTDGIITQTLCEKVAEAMADKTVLLPIVTYGYSPHHEDFPGSLNISYDVMLKYIRDIGLGLAAHDFKRLLLVNGHGSNAPIVELAHRRINYESNGKILCAATSYLDGKKGTEAIQKARKSYYPGGMGHACELETSLMLVIRPDLVHIEKAKKDMRFPCYPGKGDLFMDWNDGALSFMPFWSTISKTGTAGDPTVATKENGQYWLDVAVEELCDRVHIMRNLDYEKFSHRIDHHK